MKKMQLVIHTKYGVFKSKVRDVTDKEIASASENVRSIIKNPGYLAIEVDDNGGEVILGGDMVKDSILEIVVEDDTRENE